MLVLDVLVMLQLLVITSYSIHYTKLYELFGTKKLDAIIETKSLIHALVNFTDGSTTAHIANASMQLPIAYAILGRCDEEILKPVDLIEVANLEFRKIQKDRYPIWEVKDEILNNLDLGVVLNAANEVAVDKFLKSQIGFRITSYNVCYTKLLRNIKRLTRWNIS